MVRIIGYQSRENNLGDPFFTLELEGKVEMVKSESTERYYATARRCSIPSTFTEETCKQMIGQQLPGSIAKVESEPYEYEVPETGEIILLSHRWEYQPETQMEDHVFERTNGSAVELED